MTDNGLQLSPSKSEALMLTKKWAYRSPAFHLNGVAIPFKRVMRYLGVHLDTRLTFTEHVRRAAAGARDLSMRIGRLMPNIGGPSANSRQLLHSAASSKLPYAAPIWAPTAEKTAVCKHRGLQLYASSGAIIQCRIWLPWSWLGCLQRIYSLLNAKGSRIPSCFSLALEPVTILEGNAWKP